MLALIAATLVLVLPVAPTPTSAALQDPPQDATIYAGGPQVECALAIFLLQHKGVDTGPIDPVLRGYRYDDTATTDCSSAFRMAHIAVHRRQADRASLFLTRPVSGADGRIYFGLRNAPRHRGLSEATYALEGKDGAWVVNDTIVVTAID